MSLKLRDGVYHWRKMVNGHTMSKSTRTADLKLAQQMAALWEGEAVREIVLAKTKPVSHHAVIKAFLAARQGMPSCENAEIHLRHFLKLPDTRMKELTLAQLQGVITARRAAGIAENTLSTTVSYWNAVVKFAAEQQWTTGVKLQPIKPTQTRLRTLTSEEFEAMLRECDPAAKYRGKCARTDKARQDNQDLMIGLRYLGVRYNELARMKWSAVDFDNNQVWVDRLKGGISNHVFMADRLRAMLLRRKAEAVDEWVLPSKRKNNNNFGWLADVVKRAGVDESLGKITLHTFRHTFATDLLRQGLAVEGVQIMLGHRHYQTTLIYAKPDQQAVTQKALHLLNAM